jgi:hypothetical protein
MLQILQMLLKAAWVFLAEGETVVSNSNLYGGIVISLLLIGLGPILWKYEREEGKRFQKNCTGLLSRLRRVDASADAFYEDYILPAAWALVKNLSGGLDRASKKEAEGLLKYVRHYYGLRGSIPRSLKLMLQQNFPGDLAPQFFEGKSRGSLSKIILSWKGVGKPREYSIVVEKGDSRDTSS